MNIDKMYLQAYEQCEAKNYNAALELVEKIKRLAPNYRAAYLLEIRLLDRMENYPRLMSAQMSKDNDAAQRHASAIFCAGYMEKFSATDFRILYAEFQKYLSDIVPYPKKFYKHKKIRVGFLSADFCLHAVINFAWALLTRLDKKTFMTDSILAAWKKILDTVPDSRLLLKNKILNSDDGKNFVSNRLKGLGINLARVELRGFSANHPADLATEWGRASATAF